MAPSLFSKNNWIWWAHMGLKNLITHSGGGYKKLVTDPYT